MSIMYFGVLKMGSRAWPAANQGKLPIQPAGSSIAKKKRKKLNVPFSYPATMTSDEIRAKLKQPTLTDEEADKIKQTLIAFAHTMIDSILKR